MNTYYWYKDQAIPERQAKTPFLEKSDFFVYFNRGMHVPWIFYTGKVQKMKAKMVFALVLLLLFSLALIGCDEDAGKNGANGRKSVVIIENSPGSGSLIVCDSPAPVTVMDWAHLSSGAIAVGVASDRSTYNMSAISGYYFLKTGNYLVLLSVGTEGYFKENVSFKDGSATINFNNMTPLRSLPSGY